MSSEDYKVLVVVDLQNCFIQGGSLGSQNIKDLENYIELVEGIDKKITENKYDLVVFSKDSHPLNHSSLSDNTSPQHGIFNYHCRDSKNNCNGDNGIYSAANSTYMSEEAKNKLKDFLFSTDVINKMQEEFEKLKKGRQELEKPEVPKEVNELNELKKEFYNVKSTYTYNDYNFYNPNLKEFFSQIIQDKFIDDTKLNESLLYEITSEMDDKKYAINTEEIKTLEDLITEYTKNSDLEEKSKTYLNGILEYLKGKGKKINVQGLDLNYLFYNTKKLKDIIFNLNDKTNQNVTEIGLIKGDDIKNEPNYSDERRHNVDKIVPYIDETETKTKFITIAKGQYCDYESYSAFNYHIKIIKENDENKSVIYKMFKKYDSSLNKLIKLPAEKKYSTGLFEYILNNVDEKNSKNINIDVCGLVTNICVVNTVHQGIAMWDKVYKSVNTDKTCTFNLLEYLSIPLKISFPAIPSLNYEYEQQINKATDRDSILKQLINLKTLFDAKFIEDVVEINYNTDSEKSLAKKLTYNVDYNLPDNVDYNEYLVFNKSINGGNKLKSKNNNLIRINKVKTAPAKAPKTAPAKAPKTAPAKAPKTAPAKAPKTAPAKAPKTAPAKAPKTAPKTAPVKAPKTAQAKAPKTAPVKAPAKAPKTAPVKAPKTAPAKAPKTAPVKVSKTAPVKVSKTAPAKASKK